ncbi:sugar phosphate isomerase/epimerase family protein [Tichowtungia aerotolerans]|uniref:Sugar phosphate isomerase/epimerase n=1 Tax=Tichowtungia aerotolerans TaxID=2697043 RepID=A0A6P1M7U9_9BACT|nr:hypothetical protein [Tichowtungia aerotolerans]QHI70122.1 hypothetical protein GT409_11935 [Tichowtungia aerotolerans]
MEKSFKIYMATVLLDRNRWTEERNPSVKVSNWLERFSADGFDGLELWSFHATYASEEEQARLEQSALPIRLFNSYACFDREDSAQETDVVAAIRFGARGIKYNIGSDPALRKTYLKQLAAWRERVPQNIQLLCECHPGTIIEQPVAARAFFDELGMDGHGIIVHPFSRFDSLEEWLDLFGPDVMHAHMQMTDESGKLIRFDKRSDLAEQAIRIMQKKGYCGSYSLEFTEGVAAPGETPEMLYENARKDLSLLRSLLA